MNYVLHLLALVTASQSEKNWKIMGILTEQWQ